MQRWMVSLMAAALLSGCVSRTVVRRITQPSASAPNNPAEFAKAPGAAEAMSKGGVYYALPLTRVIAEVTVERSDFTPGKFKEHAATCLGISEAEVRKEAATTFRVSAANIVTQNEPDPRHVFLMDPSGRYFENKSMKASFSSAGTLSSLSMESDDQSVQVGLEVLKAAAGLASKATFGTGVAKAQEAKPAKPTPEEAACHAYRELVKDRGQLLKESKAGVSKETFLAAMAELDEAIEAVLAANFLGTTAKQNATRRFVLIPSSPASALLLSLQKGGAVGSPAGLCQVNTALLAAANYPKNFFSQAACTEAMSVDLSLASNSVPSLGSVIGGSGVAETGLRGPYYRIPVDVPAKITLTAAGQVTDLTLQTLEVAQFGPVVSLPASTGGRKTAYTADFTPAGALKNFQVNSTALLDKGLVDALKSTADSALDAYNKSNDPVSPLKKKKELLDAQKAVLDAQKALEKAQAEAGAAKQE